MIELDAMIRAAAFEFLDRGRQVYGETIPREVLRLGFEFQGSRVPLVGPQGIFKPALMPEMPLSITTSKSGPYADEIAEDGLLRYRYRGNDPSFHENVRLRKAMNSQTPLVYLSAVETGEYAAFYPVFVVRDFPEQLTVEVDIAQGAFGGDATPLPLVLAEPERRYRARTVNQRLHQAKFAANVMRAYETTCSVCRLKRRQLLDAAHILPDKHPLAKPVVSNGMSMCKIHHAAFDNNLIGIRPDLVVEVRSDLLAETDGPMLAQLQSLNGNELMWVPRRSEWKPDRSLLEERFEQFRRAG